MKQPRTLDRIMAGGTFLIGVLRSILFTVFVILVALVAVAYLRAPGWLMIPVGIAGLVAGVALSRRLWFPRQEADPEPAEAAVAESHVPGVQDQFDRLRTRQCVFGSVLVLSLLALAAVRLAYREDWPTLFGVSREHFLAGALAAIAIALPLGLLNWRCPNCKTNLGRSLSIRKCPKCGVVLRG